MHASTVLFALDIFESLLFEVALIMNKCKVQVQYKLRRLYYIVTLSWTFRYLNKWKNYLYFYLKISDWWLDYWFINGGVKRERKKFYWTANYVTITFIYCQLLIFALWQKGSLCNQRCLKSKTLKEYYTKYFLNF